MRRAAGHVLRWLAAIVGGLALVAGFLVWRLSEAPLSLDALAPSVARGLAGSESGLVVEIDHTLLSLGPHATIDIVARGVHLRRGEARLTLPELVIGFSVGAAFKGVLAPTEIALDEPQLTLVRAADGRFHLGLGEASGSDDWGEQLLRDLGGAPDRQGTLGYLTQVVIRRASLTVDDRALGLSWRAKRLDARMFRGARSVFGTLSFTAVEPHGKEAALHGAFRYVNGEQHLAVELDFAALTPALFADAAPALAPLAVLQLPFSGRLRLALDTAGLRISGASCDVTLGTGEVVHPRLEGGRVAIASGLINASYDPAQGRISIERFGLDLGGPRLELAGSIDGVGDGVLVGGWPQAVTVEGDLHLNDVPVDALAAYWPEHLSSHSRQWVTEHVHDGVVTEAAAHLAAEVDMAADAAKPVRVDTFAGTVAYRGLTVDYFKPLEPLRGVDGVGSFDRAHFDLVPSSGHVRSVALVGGAAKLTKLDTDDEQIEIDFGIKGPLRDVLEVLDEKPLGYAQALGISPARVAGEVDGQLSFALPLKKDLKLAMVRYGARAKLIGVALPQVLSGHDLSDGDLKLRLDPDALTIDGTAALAGVPATLSWTEALKKGGPRAHYAVKARLDAAARHALGIDLPVGSLEGPVAVDAVYTVLSAKHASAHVVLDGRDAALDVAKLNWRKPKGVPMTGSVDLDLVDGHLRTIRPAVLKGGGLDARLGAMLDDAGAVQRVDVTRLVAGSSDFRGTVTRRGEGGWRVEVHGRSFDATGLMSDLDRTNQSDTTEPPLIIDAKLDRVILGPGREARKVVGQVYSDGIHWQAMSIDAALTATGKASLRFGRAAGDRSFRLTTDDMGALLRLFDVSENVAGGQLEVTGRVEDKGRQRTFRGDLQGSDYRLVHAPIIAKVLSVASLSAVSSLLQGEGIPFTRIKGSFVIDGGRIQVKELRAYGGAIGVKVDGFYDFDRQTLDVAGTLVPAYTLNSVLGNIPLLGTLLTGGQGEGIFAANFRVAGTLDAPEVTVNPLSVLAPGLLRKLFLFDAPEPSPPAGSGSSTRR
jgi:hypothetical protein